MLDENSNSRGPSTVAGNSNKGRPEASFDIMDFAPMSIDELSKLHESVEAVLAKKIAAEIIALERDLERLSPAADIVPRGSQKTVKSRGHRASALSPDPAKVSQSNATIRNMGRSRKATAVADRAA